MDQQPVTERRSNSAGNRAQAELGRALKEFFGDIKPVQQNLKFIHKVEPPSNNLQDVARDLDKALKNLKSAVSAAVQMHKEDRNSEA